MSRPMRGRPANHQISDETREGILAIFLLAVSLLLLLSLLDAAGAWGMILKRGLEFIFGSLRFLAPIVFFISGYYVAIGSFPNLVVRKKIGLILTTIGFFSLAALWNNYWPGIVSGGYLGEVIIYLPKKNIGDLASVVIFLSALLVGIFLFYSNAYTLAKNLFFWLARVVIWALQSVVGWLRGGAKEYITPEGVEEIEPVEDAGRTFKRVALPNRGQVVNEESTVGRSAPVLELPALSRKRIKSHEPAYSLDLLEDQTSAPESGNTEVIKNTIEKTFATFGISVEMGEVHVGPTVTQYTLKPAEGVKLTQITSLNDNLALQLAAHPIRIEAPIPGKSLVGIEVPNKRIAIVSLKGILGSPEYLKLANSPKSTPLLMVIGRDVAGEPWIADLGRMPHLLIAGATGSGKTVAINTIIMSLLYHNSPDDLHFILVDPKRVELPVYNDIPHLVTPVITDVRKTINSLRWVIGEMDRRFNELQRTGHRDIGSYNDQEEQNMPYLVVIIDELADLMVTAAHEVEASIIRLAQMSRAVGIHLVMATQRPSVDVITGLIKANVTSRMAFSVASGIDSRTIIDTTGAEKLLGRGDLLFVTAELSKPKRIQGAFVSDRETKKVSEYLRSKGTPTYVEGVQERNGDARVGDGGNSMNLDDDGDELLEEAKGEIIRMHKASASLLQRRLKIGYARAARILDILEAQGMVGPSDGAKAREVLIGRGENGSIEGGEDDFSTDEDEVNN